MTDGNRRGRTVAFIGLGMMGLPMAARLVEAGFTVRGADLSAAAREAFAARGGKAFATARGSGRRALTIVITMLPDGAIVRDALLGQRRRGRACSRPARWSST